MNRKLASRISVFTIGVIWSFVFGRTLDMDDDEESSNTSEEVKDVGREWEKYQEMSVEKKRQYYRCADNYEVLQGIQTWADQSSYLSKVSTAGKQGKQATYSFNDKLNRKVSLWEGDITTLEIDAIVNAANRTLLGGGGVDGCIHRAAGPTLVKECNLLGGCETGDTKITSGHKLPAKYILHTVGPVGKHEDKLKSCYKTCLDLCLENRIKSVAFCCISTGIYGYPAQDAAEVALQTTRKWLQKNPDAVDRIIFCLFLQNDVEIYRRLMFKYFPPREEGDKRESEKKRQNAKQQQDDEKEEVTEDKAQQDVQTAKKHKTTERETTKNQPEPTDQHTSDEVETALEASGKDEPALEAFGKDETALEDANQESENTVVEQVE